MGRVIERKFPDKNYCMGNPITNPITDSFRADTVTISNIQTQPMLSSKCWRQLEKQVPDHRETLLEKRGHSKSPEWLATESLSGKGPVVYRCTQVQNKSMHALPSASQNRVSLPQQACYPNTLSVWLHGAEKRLNNIFRGSESTRGLC